MIDLEKRFGKFEKQITEECNDAFEKYKGSSCYKLLKSRYDRLRNSNDMNFGAPDAPGGNFKSKVAFPIVKERTLIREAILAQNFRGDPLITVIKAGNTTPEKAKNVQDLLTHNLRTTLFRERCFRQLKYSAARYGSAVCFSAFKHSQKMGWNTVNTPIGIDREYGIVDENQVALNIPVNILNYVQDPNVSLSEASYYRGHTERVILANLIARIKQNPDVYKTKAVKEMVKKAEKASLESEHYHKDKDNLDNYSRKFLVDVSRIFIQLNMIKGNEDDESHYYVEMADKKIIRFQHNPNDKDLVPYSVFNYYPREDFWWGNCDSEFVLPHENFTNLIMGMKADNALRALEQYIFYGKGTIDPADWNNRHVSGGLVPVDLKGNQDLRNLLHMNQWPDVSLQTTDSLMREIKESQQRMTPRPDFTRQEAKGSPLRNTTATAANILEEQGDVLEAHILEGFSYGLKDMARSDIIILQQRLSDAFSITPEPKEPDTQLMKYEILGDYAYKIETSLTKNKSSELVRLQNILTGLQNFRGTQDPSWMNVNMEPIIKNFLQKADVGDIDEIYPPVPAQPMQAPMQGGMQGGMQGQPQGAPAV